MTTFVSRRPAAQRICASIRVLVCCLIGGAALFAGCSTSGSRIEGVPVGTWTTAFDRFVITATTLAYYDSPTATTPVYQGTIRYLEEFNPATAVMIIEYQSGGIPQYYQYDASWNPVGPPVGPLGNFRGVYLTNSTAATIEISATADSSEPYFRSEKQTLADAKAAYTLDHIDNYVTARVAYAKQ